jgi:cell division protein FtsA
MNKIVTGIDVGTYHVKAVIAQLADDPRQPPRILGSGYAESRGMKQGYITSIEEASRSIAAAVAQASRAAKVPIKRAYVGLGGVGLDEAFARGEAVVERGDSEITDRDIPRAIAASEKALAPSATLNRKVIHTIPLRFLVDGVPVMGGSPIGMKGMRISVETLFITCIERHVRDLVEAVEAAGIEVEDLVASPIAASFVALNKMQKRVGCVLTNIGAETLSILVFEDNKPISLKVFPTGGADITNDLALALKIAPEEAELLKAGGILNAPVSKKKVDDFINRRLSDLFKQIEAHLKRIGKSELLPAGAVLTGGSASLAGATNVAKTVLKLPSRIAALSESTATSIQLGDGIWAVAYGLTVWGFTSGEGIEQAEASSFGDFKDAFKGTLKYLKKFLP